MQWTCTCLHDAGDKTTFVWNYQYFSCFVAMRNCTILQWNLSFKETLNQVLFSCKKLQKIVYGDWSGGKIWSGYLCLTMSVYKLFEWPSYNTVWTILTFAVNCSHFMCAHLFEIIFIIFFGIWAFFHMRIVNQTG